MQYKNKAKEYVGIIYILCLLLSLIFIVKPALAEPTGIAHLQWLDKVTARISNFELKLGETTKIGPLSVTLRYCDRTPPEEAPESTAFLEIIEQRTDEEPSQIFMGWMFASSPAVNSLEHPVYDIWLLNCAK